MKKFRVGLVSLGCDKNRIDSEIILGQLNESFNITPDPKDAEIIIINTCGFIESSKQESIDTILEMSKYKKTHNCKVLIATGCLTKRYGKELMDLMPELDIILGVNDYDNLLNMLNDKLGNGVGSVVINEEDTKVNEGKRVLTTTNGTAYLRISEGCNKGCTYCIIPEIRGKYRSRTIESIVDEAKDLANAGVKEIILVAQDTTFYGLDLYKEKRLHELIREISKIDGIYWIRVLYCYPEELYDELIDEIANNEKVVKYLDIPIQHISNNILKRMKRATRKEIILEKIDSLRERIPNLVLRTSIIVGFPGETEEDFEELVDFVKSFRINNLGVFTYSREEGTPAADMDNQISEEVKDQRRNRLMAIQSKLYLSNDKRYIGNVYDVIIEGRGDGCYLGRNYAMTPDVDGRVCIRDTVSLKAGDIVKVRIQEASEYELIGVVDNESC